MHGWKRLNLLCWHREWNKPEVQTLNPKVQVNEFDYNQYVNEQIITLFSKESEQNEKLSHYKTKFKADQKIVTLEDLKEAEERDEMIMDTDNIPAK